MERVGILRSGNDMCREMNEKLVHSSCYIFWDIGHLLLLLFVVLCV
jgi:hypothetical protein